MNLRLSWVMKSMGDYKEPHMSQDDISKKEGSVVFTFSITTRMLQTFCHNL